MFKTSERAMIHSLMSMGTVSQVGGVIIINGDEMNWELQILTQSSLDSSVRYCASVGCECESFSDIGDALDALEAMAHSMIEEAAA